MNNEKTYPIKAVSQKTGITLHVIRAWEKRYQAVVPIRTDTNRRLYRESDIEKLILLKDLIENGHNIGSIANLSLSELRELSIDNPKYIMPAEDSSPTLSSDPYIYIERCLEAVQKFSSRDLELAILNASVSLSQPILFEKVLIPLSKTIGNKWQSGELRIYQEHMFSTVVKTFLLSQLDSSTVSEQAPNIIVTTPPGQAHEIGALIAACYASSDGWKVSYLGPNLPAEEVLAASIRLGAKIIALSIVYPEDYLLLKKDLQKFGEVLPKDIKLIIGGQGAENYLDTIEEINGHLIHDFMEFRKLINELRKIYFI